MSTNTKDPALADHLAWLGYVQPEGLVVSAPALVDAQAIIDRAQLGELQRRFAEHVSDLPIVESDAAETQPGINDLPRFFQEFLGWQPELIHGLNSALPLPESLSVSLPEFQETLQPTFAVKNPHAKEGASAWLLLVQSHPSTVDLDKPSAISERNWHASPAKKFERLLRETTISIGLITNGTHFRLIYAPSKENSGALTFPVGAMTEVSGRLILGAFQLLLGSWTLFTAPGDARLPALLQRSRDYQASVSEILAEQVLHTLYELLRGFEAAQERTQANVLHEIAAKNPEDIYGGLVSVLLRLVFILFAEDRGLLPGSGLYVRHYAVRGLFERLRADAERYPDTMDHRFGAWAQLLVLFRLIHGGCQHPDLKMPARAGHLFDPDRYPFLEGRASRSNPVGALPLVSDGTIHRILEKLCILEGERVSYRTLDVEEIGSVYQTIMGFCVETTAGTAIAFKGKRKHGGVPAAPVISLDHLLSVPVKDRAKWLKESADAELSGEADKQLKAAATVDDLLVALEKRVDRHATPAPVPKGGLILQPTDERRRSGSHYTPRSFTEPIVRKTLEPILKRFGDQPTPMQILELKICDMAVGSAAFLVETCRQLADVLVRAWRVHGGRPMLPPDETEELLAMRTIAQRCLYGVDRNPMAVDLAKLSLWLATLAKDHPFTFLDHAIRRGDALVGLTRRQIETFTWKTGFATGQFFEQDVRARVQVALQERQALLAVADDFTSPQLKRQKLAVADEQLDLVRFIGDAALAAFFAADKDKAREVKRTELAERISVYLSEGDLNQRPIDEVKALRGGKFPVIPFHWEIEFPEVFDRKNPGFDAIVGNPPFLGGKRTSTVSGEAYLSFLLLQHPDSHGNADLVAFFFRRAFYLLSHGGALGLIATNTISQGDTRSTGLRVICRNGGDIYNAQRRCRWPGEAAVLVSIVHIFKGSCPLQRVLDRENVGFISAYLFHAGGHEDPSRLKINDGICFLGFKVYGQGFLFDDSDANANSIEEMNLLISRNSRNKGLIYPFLGGEELNDHPEQQPRRFAINFGDSTEEQASHWPDLYTLVKAKVKPEREILKRKALQERWWQFGERQPGLVRAMQGLGSVIVCCQTSKFRTFALCPSDFVFSHKTVVICSDSLSRFAVLHSRFHELWALFFGSSLEDRPVYTGSDCFETFPFPAEFETNMALEVAGREYYEFRAELMQDLWLGLTEIYNLFHSPNDEALARLEALYRKRAANSDWLTAEGVPANRSPLKTYADPSAALVGVQRLRELHSSMDAIILATYGWTDMLPKCTCEFLLDYEDDESESGVEESTRRKKKKPWRYRWPDEVRNEILARLLKLNAERAEEERQAGEAIAKSAKPVKKATAKTEKMQFTLGMGTPGTVERILPADFRLPASQPLLYTTNLVVALLSEAGGSLSWPRLLDTFILATTPSLIQRLAPADDSARVKAWVERWNESVTDGLLIPSLEQLGAKNLTVTAGNDGPVFHLLDGPRQPATDDVAYDAWLALHIAAILTPDAVQIPERTNWTKEVKKLVLA